MKQILWIVFVLLLTLVMLTSCSTVNYVSDSAIPTSASDEFVHRVNSLVTVAENMDEMLSYYPHAAIVSVVSSEIKMFDNGRLSGDTNANTEAQSEVVESDIRPYTLSKVIVEEVLEGDALTVGQEFYTMQSGDGQTWIYDLVEMNGGYLTPGSRWLVYLWSCDQYKEYFLVEKDFFGSTPLFGVGNHQGKFQLSSDDKIISPVNDYSKILFNDAKRANDIKNQIQLDRAQRLEKDAQLPNTDVVQPNAQ